MAKKKTAVEKDEDQLIIDGLNIIREGILTGVWSVVCQGYNSIMDDNLIPFTKPEEPKLTKLQKIRLSKNSKNATPQPEKVLSDDVELPHVLEYSPTDPVKVEKQKGGSRFAREGFEIIEIPLNKKEANDNLKEFRPRPKAAVRKTGQRDNSETSSDVRFYNKNTPPRREE